MIDVQILSAPINVVTVQVPQTIDAVQVVTNGPQGAQGNDGDIGPPGISGARSTLPFASALAVWNLPHGMGCFPSITIVDSSGSVVFGDVSYLDSNNARVSFGWPLAGVAYLN